MQIDDLSLRLNLKSLTKEYLTANMAEKHRTSKNNTVKVPHINKKMTKKCKKSQKIIIKSMFRLETLNIFIADCT